MTIAIKIQDIITRSSWIRKMFEQGANLKAEHGPENVFDFSLGNPNMEPPEKFQQALVDIASSCEPGGHGYMPNAGYPDVRKAVADYISVEQQVEVTSDEVVMTCGAAGALNVIFKALLNPGDEIITPIPCFVEYNFYADNHGGKLVTVNTRPDFSLDTDAVSAAITEKTKIVLINSPNNPTGQVYSKEDLDALGKILEQKSKEYDHTIYLVSDEPYRKIIFKGVTVPSIFTSYNDSIVATSYSKDISIPGERAGNLAVNPKATYKNTIMEGVTLANRILGFVNAPAIMQKVIARVQGESVDISEYERKRNLLCDGLKDCGYEFTKPAGAFYLFPKSPIPDDVEFVNTLQDELIIGVPGSGFNGPGFFRLAFCVDDATITNSMPGFKKAIDKYR